MKTMEFDQSFKPKRAKTREVSSRFRSPSTFSTSGSHNQINPMTPSNHILSTPPKKAPRSSKGSEKSGFMAKLWPSSVTSSFRLEGLAVHGREEEELSSSPASVSRQMSCRDFSRFAGEKDEQGIARENQRPLFGGSMRYAGKFATPTRSSTSPSSSSSCSSNFSNLLEDYSEYRKRSDFLSDLESEDSEILSNSSFSSPIITKNRPPSYMAPTLSSSKSLQDPPSRSRRWSSDSGLKKTREDNPSRKAGSLKRSSSVKPAPSSLRRSNPPRGEVAGIHGSYTPTNPSRVKGVGSFFSMGLELLKVKKSSSKTASSSSSVEAENVQSLRMMHNRLLQWRYVNAKSDAVNEKISRDAQKKLIYAEESISKLRQSVVQKKIQLQKQKLEMKLASLLHSQIKQLEDWGDMETKYLSSISMTKDSLHSVVCKVPLIQGAKVDPESTSIALQDASDLAASIELMLSSLSTGATGTAEVMKETAEVVIQEKLLLEECLELFKNISRLEIEERSLKCNLIQLRLQQQEELLLSAH
ncbi:unnamed protein product [Cuscuta epithymum]|uniref:QWRF motif-containing protein 3 n=1 Tax=Cuscuta epithymum TaxID=186058 RepID=A0AAV0EEF8_9ASTE|nr:unnamed protein product [Cuscuta epithymum]